MAQDRVKQLLQQGIAAAKAQQKDQAHQILQRVVKLDPRNEVGWLWLSSVARNPQEQIFCLKQLYAINPNSEMAIKGLQALGIDPTQQQPAAQRQAAGTPQVSIDKLRSLQEQIDKIVADYRPELYTPLEIDWVQKEKNRYGEATARRIKRTAYATAAIAGLAVLVLVGFLLVTLVSSLSGDEEQVADNRGLFTATPSLVPTITPTPTVNPNTPIPPNVFSTPTPVQPPNNVPRGQEGVEPTPTGAYPVIQQSEIRDALVFFDRGDYEQVSEISAPFQTDDARICLPEMYYFDAVGRALQGGAGNLQTAEQLLQQALNFQQQGNFQNECSDPPSPLLLAGLCFVRYQEALATPTNATALQNEALSLCQESHTADPALVPPVLTMADIYIAQQNYTAANEVLLETLNYARVGGTTPNIGNVELLLKLSEVEAAQQNFDAALEYVATAIFISPELEAALVQRVDLNLAKARATEDERLRQVLYGYVAVLAEEQYLSRYPGAAQGYVYVAEGRLREGNPERALESLARVIQVASEPGVDPAAVQRAYALRAEIALLQQDWETAFDLLSNVLDEAPENLQWREWRYQVALQLNEYDTALDDLNVLLATEAVVPEWVVDAAMIRSQICQYTTGITCDFDVVLDQLTDAFVDNLADAQLAARANAYRVEAEFAGLPPTPSETALVTLRDRLLLAMERVETGENYYLLGRIYTALEQYPAALRAYEWIIFWDAVYNYPFTDDVEDEIEAVEEQLEAADDSA
jgi:tetratricopeptide (TPR) repeat protein